VIIGTGTGHYPGSPRGNDLDLHATILGLAIFTIIVLSTDLALLLWILMIIFL
jgi:hypothetical protein